MSTIIKAENLGINFSISKSRGSFKVFIKNLLKKKENKKFWALRNVSFEIQKGEILGVVGANACKQKRSLNLSLLNGLQIMWCLWN